MVMGGAGSAGRRIYGVVVGIVSDNNHPDGEYRVKVKFPWIRSTDPGSNDDEDFFSSWARISTPMAGPGRGMYLLPEVEDEVLVMFEHGDVRFPVVVGSLWNGKDLPPVAGKAPAATTDPLGVDLGIGDACVDTADKGANNRARFFYSRSGHMLLFDDAADQKDEKIVLKTARGHTIVLNDKDGKEGIAVYDSKGDEYLYLDEKNKKIILETKNGDIDILCKKGTLNIEAKDIKMKASKTVGLESGTTWAQKAGSTMDVKAASNITVKGAKIDLN
ncbi:MAG: phage tail protein [Deltaproteobacteria bacterium]|nr:phage tail protein [Deltaproteobacteria bacterium]MCB9785487.1 phage tail protein [Deltaproteobacteria bacterium]